VDWSERDQLELRGEPDRRFVALTEKWEVEHFINRYLRTRGMARTQLRFDAIEKAIRRLNLASPILRDDLIARLDESDE